MLIYDSHIHTKHSHDGKASVEEIVKSASDLGLSGVTITDHFDCERYSSKDDFKHIYKSLEDIEKASKKSEIDVLKGVEIGDWVYSKEFGDYCIKTCDFDFILASIHSASTGKRVIDGFDGYKCFLNTTPEEDVRFVDFYYENLKNTAQYADFDSLAHLTYPLRYLNGMCQRNFSLENYIKEIEEILKTIIAREKAIEINTSGLKNNFNDTMPHKEIIKLYYDMGGRLITIGSDAHLACHIATGFDETYEVLKKIGFENYYIYKSRKPVPISIL